MRSVKDTLPIAVRLSNRESTKPEDIAEAEALSAYRTWLESGHSTKQIIVAALNALRDKVSIKPPESSDRLATLIEEMHAIVVGGQRPMSEPPREFTMRFTDGDETDTY